MSYVTFFACWRCAPFTFRLTTFAPGLQVLLLIAIQVMIRHVDELRRCLQFLARLDASLEAPENLIDAIVAVESFMDYMKESVHSYVGMQPVENGGGGAILQ